MAGGNGGAAREGSVVMAFHEETSMKTWIHALARTTVCCVVLIAGVGASAQQAPAGRTELKRVDLSGAPNMEVITAITEIKPGEQTTRHVHHGIETGYVLQGSTIQYPGKDPVDMPTGTPILNLRDVGHGGYTVVGKTSLKLFTVHIVDKGRPLYDAVP
jgi:quercetin dioxygenase-like cupin family protein